MIDSIEYEYSKLHCLVRYDKFYSPFYFYIQNFFNNKWFYPLAYIHRVWIYYLLFIIKGKSYTDLTTNFLAENTIMFLSFLPTACYSTHRLLIVFSPENNDGIKTTNFGFENPYDWNWYIWQIVFFHKQNCWAKLMKLLEEFKNDNFLVICVTRIQLLWLLM